jgi:squalene-hopene/tetraprenyl-beta-curcumene cyclase
VKGTKLVLAAALCAPAALAGCGRQQAAPGARIDRALGAAQRYLVAAQSADGAWRSRTYGVFKDGLSLSPTVLKAVTFGPDVPGAADARRRGADYLIGRVRSDASIDEGPHEIVYPVYTAAAAVLALSRSSQPGARRAIDAWLAELRRRQLTEDLGWQPDDAGYGGWGYAVIPPVKHPANAGHVDADISSTLFAVGAMRVGGVDAGDPAIRKALAFIERCQNLGEPGDSRFDDGGFFFSPVDPVRNKAGVAGTDRLGRVRYNSYGSATADGIRALVRSGLAPDHPRVLAGRRWLERYFSATTNPGTFEPLREIEREATYYYYCWSVAHAFRALGVERIRSGDKTIAWADVLAGELLRRQRADGSWSNPYTASKEDDPLVATSFAAGAIGAPRAVR